MDFPPRLCDERSGVWRCRKGLKNNIMRFKITLNQETISRHDTTEDMYRALKKLNTSLNTYYVECTVDEIEVEADEFITAWEGGERMDDLQFF